MNNLIKNVAIWLVISLVLMTVFNQFTTRQTAQSPMEYSQFIEEVKQGKITSDKPVEVKMARGTLNANRLEILNSGEVIRFEGGVVMHLQPDAAKEKRASNQ